MNFLALLLVLVLVACLNVCDRSPFKSASAIELKEKATLSWRQFQSFRRKYEKEYGSPCEEQKRYRIFKENLKKIERLNAEEKGTAVFGISEFADWSHEEFLARLSSLKPAEISENSEYMQKVTTLDSDGPIPDEFDWRSTGSVTSVKDQTLGRSSFCGSCWAFATVANIENIHAIKTGSLQDYSAQLLVDCSPPKIGCHGAPNATFGFETVIKMDGLVSESEYPYTGEQSDCKLNPNDVTVEIEGFDVLNSHDEKFMKRYIATKGSTVNAINTTLLHFYLGGIIVSNEDACSEDYNHLVVVVGYGRDSDSGLDFWTVKNSFGPSWGEAGYLRVKRGKNTCGISRFIGSARLKDDDHVKPKHVERPNL